MNKKIILILGIFVFLLAACEPDEETIANLKEKIEQEKQKIQLQRQNVENIQKEIMEIAVRSLHYRFPDIQKIPDEPKISINLPDLPYLKEIEIQTINTQKMIFRFSYKTQEKNVSPHFTLFLFTNDGMNIHKEEIAHKGIFGDKYLKVDEKTTQEKTIQIYGNHQVQYFLIRENQ